MKRLGIAFLILCFALVTGSSFALFARDNGDIEESAKNGHGKLMDKLSFEIALGIGRVDPTDVYLRSAGIDAVVSQYAGLYNLSTTSTGDFSQSKMTIPINILVNYTINEKWYLSAGFDFSSGSNSSQKDFALGWTGFTENQSYDVSYKFSCFMPRIGGGYKYKLFNFYGALGLGMAKLTHTQSFTQSEPGFTQTTSHEFKVDGTAPALILGAQYRKNLRKKVHGRSIQAFVRLEYVLLKINTLTGTKTSASRNSQGSSNSQTLDGTLYQFTWNPLAKGSIQYWDLFETGDIPGSSTKLALDLSSLRLMIGITF